MMAIIIIGYYVSYPSRKSLASIFQGRQGLESNTWASLWEQLGVVTVTLRAVSENGMGLGGRIQGTQGGKAIVYGGQLTGLGSNPTSAWPRGLRENY